ncbi:MAG: hypothetical protein WCO52_05975 [bacterium]
MTIAYSTNLGLISITTGTESGLWGSYTNTNVCTLIEQAISGYGTQAITDGADTVVSITNGASSTGRNMVLKLTGALTASRNLIVPTVPKLYFINNATTDGGVLGPYAVTVKTSGGTGISVPNGKTLAVYCDGTNVLNAMTAITAGGTTTQMQYNNAGSLAGSAMTYVVATGAFTVAAPTTTSATALTISAASAAPAIGLSFTSGQKAFSATDGSITTFWDTGSTRLRLGTTTNNGVAIACFNFDYFTISGTGSAAFAAPASGATVTINGVANNTGNTSLQIADPAAALYDAGYATIPQVGKTASYPIVSADANKHIYYTGTATGPIATMTIPANTSVTFPIGTTLMFVNDAAAAVSIFIAITSDVLVWTTAGTTGPRTLGRYGIATAVKVTSTRWFISGSNLT